MAQVTKIEYSCDKCGAKLRTCENTLHIVTEVSEPSSVYWERVEVKIVRHSGVHNDSETADAELCKRCAIALLKDALYRVRAGERATAGVKSSRKEGWERR